MLVGRNAKNAAARIRAGTGLLSLVVVLAIVAPIVAPLDSPLSPGAIELARANLPPLSPYHLLGTDLLGRDVLSQALWGARASLLVGLLAATLAVTFGSIWGALSAFSGGTVDSLMMRVVDGMLSIPNIVLLLTLNSLLDTDQVIGVLPSWLLSQLSVTNYSSGMLPIFTVVLVIGATTWLEAARIARAKIKSVKVEEYVTAARALGVGTWRMLSTHLIPNALPILLVEGTLLISDAILMEAGLSFLGLGLGPSTPSWGTMLASAQASLIQGNWWTVLVPGALITTTVLAVNLMGEGYVDATGGGRKLGQPA